MNFRSFWLSSCFGNTESESIHAIFKCGREADYTMDAFHLLASDPAINEIYSNETGELCLYTDEAGERHITGWN